MAGEVENQGMLLLCGLFLVDVVVLATRQTTLRGITLDPSKCYVILEENLVPLMEIFTHLCGASLDEWWEWHRNAILVGVEPTDVETGNWFEYEIEGKYKISFRLARNPIGQRIYVDVDGPRENSGKFKKALCIETSASIKKGS